MPSQICRIARERERERKKNDSNDLRRARVMGTSIMAN